VDAWKRAGSGSTRRFAFRFLDTQDEGAALRIGERDDFSEQMISGICSEVAARQPRIAPISLGGQFSFEFEKLVFVWLRVERS
jgi:hypothetical protein